MPHRLLSMLAHVELLTPDLDASVAFAHDMLGMHVVEEQGDSTYLRCWGDDYRYSLVLTRAAEPGIGHAAWRTDGEEQLGEAVAAIEASGTTGSWLESSFGHGRAYRFEGPGGQTHELFWEVERAVAPPGEESPYPARVQRASAASALSSAGGAASWRPTTPGGMLTMCTAGMPSSVLYVLLDPCSGRQITGSQSGT